MERGKRKRNKFLDKDDVMVNYHCRFVAAGVEEDFLANDAGTSGDSFDCKLTGDEVRSFYEEIVNDNQPGSSKSQNGREATSAKTINLHSHVKIETKNEIEPLDIEAIKKYISSLFKLSSDEGKISKLKKNLNTIRKRPDYTSILNASDQYGWTALMCAAAAGCLNIVTLLVEEGAKYEDIKDKGGCNIYDICERNNQHLIAEYLRNTKLCAKQTAKKKQRLRSTREELITCELCGVEYKSHLLKEHESSMVHLFKDDSRKVPRNIYSISDNNVGFQMMIRSGWEVDSGLGPDGSGRKNPIKTILKHDRAGLGLTVNPEKRISHFNAFDDRAVSQTNHRKDKKKDRSYLPQRNSEKKTNNCEGKDRGWERSMRRHMSSYD